MDGRDRGCEARPGEGSSAIVTSAVHDMGGAPERFGPIPVEADEPVFHHAWEARVLATTLLSRAMLGNNVDAFRWTMERLPAAQYLAGYYQRWLAGLERSLVDQSVLAPGELDARLAGRAPPARGRVRPGALRRARWRRLVRVAVRPVPRWLLPLYLRIQRKHRPAVAPPRFAIGDRVVVSAAPAAGHTRRPRYAWGKRGTIVGVHGAMVLPDRRARGERGPGEHLYTVELAGAELWGGDAEPGTTVRLDLFESYLEALP